MNILCRIFGHVWHRKNRRRKYYYMVYCGRCGEKKLIKKKGYS